MAKRAPSTAARSERRAGQSSPAGKPKGRNAAAPRASGLDTRAAERSAAPLPPLPTYAGPPADALTDLDAAMRALQRHQYQDAATRFRAILETYPRERPLLDRVRVYLQLCERELRQRPAPPRTIEERLTLATAALNDQDEETAERLSQEVLDASPDHDLALYLLAAVRARQGETQAALDLLRRALEVSPDVQAQARHDPDFDALKDHEEFRQLLDASTASDRSGQGRRSRRHRNG